jgi:hypothetical protein
MVLALKGTANLNVNNDPKESFEAIKLGRGYPRVSLINYLNYINT